MFKALTRDPFVQMVIIFFLIVLNIIFIVMLFSLNRRLNRFLKGKNGENLEGIICKSSDEIADLTMNFNGISHELENHEKMIVSTIKKIGIVRFNPFSNTGGDQSFAIAMLDSKNSGVVISSLYLREGTRVYAKPIESLKSSYPLSKEEEMAIKKAVG